jgi:hypothetical protein
LFSGDRFGSHLLEDPDGIVEADKETYGNYISIPANSIYLLVLADLSPPDFKSGAITMKTNNKVIFKDKTAVLFRGNDPKLHQEEIR